MSWFNLNVNESLNTLKGQISNVSHVVQGVLTEGILEDTGDSGANEHSSGGGGRSGSSDDTILLGLEAANKRIDDLSLLCQDKDEEIIALRKQIEHFKVAGASAEHKTTKPDSHGIAQAASIDDSWFWESEKTQSSTSSKENEATAATHVLSDIPLNPPTLPAEESTTDDRIVDRLRRSLDEKDVQIQRLIDENVRLNETIDGMVDSERQQIEQLDSQHTEAVANLLTTRNELQAKCEQLQSELNTVRSEHSEYVLKFEHLQSEFTASVESNEQLAKKCDEIERQLAIKTEENEEHVESLDRLKSELDVKIKELNAALEDKDSHSREGSDKFELIDIDKEKSAESSRRQHELDEITERLSILNDIKDQYDANVVKLSTLIEEKNAMERQMTALKNDNENLLKEVQVTREAVEKLEVLQKNLDEINSEKEQNEMAFVTLQEDELILQREFHQLKADKEKLATELESAKMSQEAAIGTLDEECGELKAKLNELQSSYDALKATASDAESRLVEENMQLQKKIIDMQSQLNSRISEMANVDAAASDISFDEIRKLISKHVSYAPSPNGSDSVESYLLGFLQTVRETYQHLADIEKNRNDLMKQFEAVSNEKATLQHEWKTLKADLHHYEKEVAELMKNNEILLVELENVKTGKLETISEQNEDNILRLEKQLEDCGKLNQSLEDEYENMQRQLDEKEEEKYELQEQITQLKNQLEAQKTARKDLEAQLEGAEYERNELQTRSTQETSHDANEAFEAQIRAQSEEIAALTKQLENLSVDHASLVQNIEPLQEDKKALSAQVEELERVLRSERSKFASLQSEYEGLKSAPKEVDEQATAGLKDRIELITVEFDEKCEEFARAEQRWAAERADRDAIVAKLNESVAVLEQKLATSEASKAQVCGELQQTVERLMKEQHELIAAVQMKHNENVQYHAKIQELNQMLAAVQQAKMQCDQCVKVGEQVTAYADEISKLNDQIEFLKEKSDIMTKNLLIEQTNQKLLQQEKVELNEAKQQLVKDLNRLREHLIEMENAHTQEMVELQTTLEDTRNEMAAMQEEARKSNTAYTSANIRANQHTETLQAQYTVLQQQKDDLLAKLSVADDRDAKNQAALTNLQCALEQFQKDKDRDVEAMTHRIRGELNSEIENGKLLRAEINSLKIQLEESKAGLLAAARISDQLEISQVTNAALKEELRKTQDKLHALEQKLHDTESNQADRVDKSLLKNLLIGYIVAPNNDKSQILKLISSVLDFNQQESDKVGLNKGHTGWLNSILHGNDGTTSSGQSQNENYNKDGLVQAFVKFLENESQPRNDSPTLLNIVHSKPATASPPTSANTSATSLDTNAAAAEQQSPPTAAIQPILLSDAMLQPFSTPRNSSSILKDILNDS